MNREFITDIDEVLELIQRAQLRYVKAWPFYSYNQDTHGLWRRVPKRVMRVLIDSEWVEKSNLGLGGGSWIYRLGPRARP